MMEYNLIELADKYETKDFLNGDPSQFMHEFKGDVLQERAAFVASAISYGSRKQFLPKIYSLKHLLEGDLSDISDYIPDDDKCFYRLHTNHNMVCFLTVIRDIEQTYGSLGDWMRSERISTCIDAVKFITSYFAERNASALIPRDAHSACKRICMFLRWMVRDNSEVDLGLWSDFIDKKTLIIPMDTHVLQEACRFGFINSKTTSMSAALKLTDKMKEYFPDDPARADFALFGLGVDKEK